ncbi:unnamed protein product [Rotaria sp. Silwood1]|nr:unnamed protein product [Rotaria sp. Silwood1]CAF3590407.1 unnamed protein product [Rotaria sp. Silwood1]CAF3610731.1 unnamed protein product [Rotaria sp. Silwood1]CAF4891936.1 unnamed protein product [Rotaria sp. Silwood1]CAF4961564.1 unnamed protein product [Rotaria sp. Silwood1]
MKFIIYSSIIYLILILQIGIKAEQLSLSFINIIPNIISHGRFIEENIINSNIEFNETYPWLNQDLIIDANESNCSRDIHLLIKDLNTRQIWALKTLDAWGKFPSGVMQGNIYWIGSVYECGHHLRGLNNSIVEQPFRTRTCVINNDYKSSIRPIYGICVPQSCNANDILTNINKRIIRIPFISRYIPLSNDSIHCIDQRSYDTKAIFTIVLLTLMAFLIFVATGMHIAYGHEHDLKIDHTTTTAYEPIDSQTITTTEALITTVTTSQSENPIDEHDEVTPLISRPRKAVDSVAQHFISCCSLIHNYRILKRENQPKNLAFLNGIRVLSLWWIILGHTFLFAAYYSDNVRSIFNWSRQVWFQIIVQAIFSIDSFFVLSGLLTAFIFFISKTENEPFSTLKFLLNHYIYRYLRYTIFYAIILLIYITLSPYLGQYGPIYPINGIETSTCRRTWWRNLLYINNFFDLRDSCMTITWFVAVNMQFHWISPLFLLTTAWNWAFGMLVATGFILVDIITTSVIVSKNNYDHGILSDLYSNRSNWSNTSHNYTNDVYVKPWCRIAPYAIGLILGYTIYELYKRSNTISWNSLLPQRQSTRLNLIKQILAWLIALFILALCIFGTYGDYNGHSLNRSERIAFLTLSRLGWSIGLSIIIIACFIGQGGIANKLLSHRFFDSLGKLTYGAYLWHALVIFVNYISRDQPTHYTMANILYDSIIHIIIAYILSFFTFLFIELPIIKLLKNAFKRPTFSS